MIVAPKHVVYDIKLKIIQSKYNMILILYIELESRSAFTYGVIFYLIINTDSHLNTRKYYNIILNVIFLLNQPSIDNANNVVF